MSLFIYLFNFSFSLVSWLGRVSFALPESQKLIILTFNFPVAFNLYIVLWVTYFLVTTFISGPVVRNLMPLLIVVRICDIRF
jgi:F0F1-type ATP synthase assembly protein I